MSILYVHLLSHSHTLFSLNLSPFPVTHFFNSWVFFSSLKNAFPGSITPHPVCLSHLLLLLSPSRAVFLASLLQLFFVVGYCCSLCLFLKDYLCSHSDEGFGKGSLSTPSFRGGPMHGASTCRRQGVYKCVCLSICNSHAYSCVCVC